MFKLLAKVGNDDFSRLKSSIPKNFLQYYLNICHLVGRVALIPTSAYMINNPYRSIKILYANVFCLYELFIYANLCRDEGNPTYY